jgi:hypothetical protein
MADGIMANPYVGLLSAGLTPEQAQAAVDQQKAMQFANMNPQQRIASGIYQGISGIGRALGVKDPMLEQASKMREMASQFDTTTAEGMMQYAQALQKMGNIPAAQQAIMQARQLSETEAKTTKAKAEAAQVTLSTQQEEKLRTELAALPEDATEADVLRVVRKYGKPGDIMRGIETSQRQREALVAKAEDRKAQVAQKEAEFQRNAELRIQLAQMNGANAQMIAKMRLDSQRELEEMRQQNRLDLFRVKQEANGTKPLSAGLQKDEDKELSQILSNKDLVDTVSRPIDALTNGTLKLGPVSNMTATLRNWAGSSNEASAAYADMQRAVQSATNIKVSAEKGVQTDKDVVRFANELIAAAGGNDTKVLKQALENFSNAAKKDSENKQRTIQSRRKSQGVGLYDFSGDFSPTPATAAKPPADSSGWSIQPK